MMETGLKAWLLILAVLPSLAWADFTVVIDPGHGGKAGGGRVDPVTKKAIESGDKSYGASWNNATSPSKILEKDLTLEYSKEIREAFRSSERAKALGVRVFLTREEDVHMSAMLRAAKAIQAKADIFVSVHFNAYSEDVSEDAKYSYGEIVETEKKSEDGEPEIVRTYFAQGTRAYVSRKTNPEARLLQFANPYHDRDRKFAEALAIGVGESFKPFRNPLDRPKHGAYDEPAAFKDGIRVLGYARQEPSMFRSVVCLLETAFISSPSVDEFLLRKNRDEARKAAAAAFVKVVCDHLETYEPPDAPLPVK